jgi:hypothetical protein
MPVDTFDRLGADVSGVDLEYPNRLAAVYHSIIPPTAINC